MKPFFVFSGQGAQKVGMGADLAAQFPAAAQLFQQADETLGYALSEIIFQGPEEKLLQTRYCQTAIYTMSCAALAVFREKFPGVAPVACAGLSLGEYGALYAAGSFDFVTGLHLLKIRSELMEKACSETSGTMASVLNGDIDVIHDVCRQCGAHVANYNSPTQIVISGEKAAVGEAVALLQSRGVRKVIPLNVAGAFHSPLMASAGQGLKSALADLPLRLPAVAVYHNFTGRTAASVAELKKNLADQVAGSVRWEECTRAMAAAGGDTMIEFGPGNVLTKLCSRTMPEIRTFNINSADSLSRFSVE